MSKKPRKLNPEELNAEKFIGKMELLKKSVKNNDHDSIRGIREELEPYRKKLRDSKLTFSFQHFEMTDIFNVNNACEGWTHLLMNRLAELSDKTIQEVVDQHRHYRSHPITWSAVEYRFHDWPDEKLEQYDCRSFSLGTSSGRVHGFYLSGIFYIVWLDPHHWLYPNENYGKVQPSKPKETCCEAHIERIKQLEQALEESARVNEDLKEQNEMLYEELDKL